MGHSQTAFWLLAATVLSVSAARAAPLVYTPVNPSFGGNPGNSSQLISEAAVNKPAQKTSSSSSSSSSSAIATQLQNSILANLSSSVAGQIVGPDSVASGTQSLGGGASISWLRSGSVVNVTVIGTDGSSTIFTVPVM